MGVSRSSVRAVVCMAHLVNYSDRMVTSKLYVDPEHVAEADKDDFAK